MDHNDRLLTTVYTVRFGLTLCLNVGACCLTQTMKSPNAHYEADRRRYDSDEVCEACDKAIKREFDSEIES